MKILILKPSSLGDVIHAIPVLRLLKRRFPASEIYWWLSSDLVPLLEDDPDLAGIFPFERRGWHSWTRWINLGADLREMRSLHFDWVIDLQGLARSGVIGWLARGATFVGLGDAREGTKGYYDVRVPTGDSAHAVDRYLQVLKLFGIPVEWDFDWLPRRPGVAAAINERWKAGERKWIVINPGARWDTKRWPAEYFEQVVRQLAADLREHQFVILGGPEEREAGSRISQAAPNRCLDLTNQTSLPEVVEWLRVADLMVTNDTGPMHIAAALKLPIVSIFGPTAPERTGPYGQLHGALREQIRCSPCFQNRCSNEIRLECLRLITPERVNYRSRELLRLDA